MWTVSVGQEREHRSLSPEVGGKEKGSKSYTSGMGASRHSGEKINRLLGEPRQARRQETSRFEKAFLFLANEPSGWVVLV